MCVRQCLPKEKSASKDDYPPRAGENWSIQELTGTRSAKTLH